MKKILHSIATFSLLFSFGTTNAQIDGNLYNAPNIQKYDIFGTYYDMYSDYLDNDIPVILDVSAHWCAPCWSYHNSYVLKDLYNQYGPTGTITPNSVMVFWADGDATSSMAELYNSGLTGSQSTQGDWVTGTPYPIFGGDTGPGANAGAQIGNDYDIAYFPTVFMIHPDRTVEEIGSITNVSTIMTHVNGANPTTNNVNDVKMKNASGLVPVGCSGDITSGVLKIQNYGTNTLTSASVEIDIPGVYTDTVNWTGNLATYEFENYSIPNILNIPDGTHTINVRLFNPNGNADEDLPNGEFTSSFDVNTSGREITIDLDLDNYPDEVSWELRNASNVVVASGGDYDGDAVELICGDSSCYTLNLFDSYGDGITSGGITVTYGTQTLGSLTASQFGGNSASISFCTYDNQIPALVTNNGISVDYLKSKNITETELRYNDSWSAYSGITFNIVNAPATGLLVHSSDSNTAVNSFTQADLFTNDIIYIHDGVDDTDVSFDFTVSDEAGNTTSTQTFNITVNAASAPVSITNLGAIVGVNSSVVITSSELMYEDDVSYATNVVYNVTSDPTHGQLERTDDAGVSINTFTQADIITKKVQYVHTGSDETPDYFEFTVTDELDNVSAKDSFNITVTNTASLNELSSNLNKLSVYPNPTADIANIEFSANTASNAVVEVVDLVGKVVISEDVKVAEGLNTITLDTEDLTSGVYMVNIISDDSVHSVRIDKN